MSKCELCGEPMPDGEEMFKYHGYSGPCPKPPLPSPSPNGPAQEGVDEKDTPPCVGCSGATFVCAKCGTSYRLAPYLTELDLEPEDADPTTDELVADADDAIQDCKDNRARRYTTILTRLRDRVVEQGSELRVRPTANEIADMNEHIDGLDQEIASLRAQLAERDKDAERYRWLRANQGPNSRFRVGEWSLFYSAHYWVDMDSLDDTIDADRECP